MMHGRGVKPVGRLIVRMAFRFFVAVVVLNGHVLLFYVFGVFNIVVHDDVYLYKR